MAKTVEYGIDLGTTNSAIARMTPKGVTLVPVERSSYVRSAVAKKRGALKVGQSAISDAGSDAAVLFKREMGSEHVFNLDGGETMSPVELSAEVLKELKRAVKRRYDEDLKDVVITVPAMFSQPQCAATQEAAIMAGLNAVALLQEPIAAATAFLTDDPMPGYYLVYDLGGGTFDVSLIRLADGEMQVVAHGGDNYLGGSDFDTLMSEWVLNQIERKGADIGQFKSQRSRRRLLQIMEEARINLSDCDSVLIDLGDFGLSIVTLNLSAPQLEDLVEETVDKTIRIIRERLASANLSPADIESILLVGGPTQMPYIRRRLREEFGIQLNHDQDPMTVVAKGAAIHAAGMLRDQNNQRPTSNSSTLQLELHYEPIAPESDQTMAGKVLGPEFNGEVKIRSGSGDWETGWIRLKRGAFSALISLGTDAMREFLITVRNEEGTIVLCEPNQFLVRSGVRSAAPVVPYSYGVVLEGGEKVAQVVKEGGSLPASNTETFKLSKTLVAGSPESATIVFVEGNSSYASDNLRVGMLQISGTDLRRTLPENTPVEVRIRVDESRLVTARVYIPLLDEEYALHCRATTECLDAFDVSTKVRRLVYDIKEIEDVVSEEDHDDLIQIERDVEQLEAVAARAEEGHQGESQKAHKHLTDARARLRVIQEKYLAEARYHGLVKTINEADSLCETYNDNLSRARLVDLKQDSEKARRLDDVHTLDEIKERVLEIFWSHFVKTRQCWEGLVDWLRETTHLANDEITYREYLHRAELALHDDDIEGVRLNAIRARGLIQDTASSRNEFFDAALRK